MKPLAPKPAVIGDKRSILMLTPPWMNPIQITEPVTADRITVVIPVKDNQQGINRLLKAIVDHCPDLPQEVIIVDNNSSTPIQIPTAFSDFARCIRCETRGPAAARNAGAMSAGTPWILFIDSDCVPTRSLIDGYVKDGRRCAFLQGYTVPTATDIFSSFYRSQQLYYPPAIVNNGRLEPWTMITANCLVHRESFIEAGSFDEMFDLAGGEDTDLGIRLHRLGPVRYNVYSVATHVDEGGIESFAYRFWRYGRGSRQLSQKYPRPFRQVSLKPRDPSPINIVLADIFVKSMDHGYMGHPSTSLPIEEFRKQIEDVI